jgi:hypothetical protein
MKAAATHRWSFLLEVEVMYFARGDDDVQRFLWHAHFFARLFVDRFG